jgi:hypothetical protein
MCTKLTDENNKDINNKVEIDFYDNDYKLGSNYHILQATLEGFGDYNLTAYLPIPIRLKKQYDYIEGATSLVYNS